MSKRRVPEKFATWIILAMAIAVMTTISLVFPPLSFPWLAWGALGYFAIMTGWKEFIVVNRRTDVASPDDQNSTTLAICAGGLVAFVVSLMGFFEIIELRYALTGLAAILIFKSLVNLTVGKK
jgi:hypothetical protein